MKILFLAFLSIYIFSCNSKHKQAKEMTSETYTYNDTVEKDSLIYLKNENVLFSGTIVEKDSVGRIVKELNYEKGRKHGKEIHYEYFYSDLPVVVMEGIWTNGKKTGIWKSHDGEGQMTIIRDYE